MAKDPLKISLKVAASLKTLSPVKSTPVKSCASGAKNPLLDFLFLGAGSKKGYQYCTVCTVAVIAGSRCHCWTSSRFFPVHSLHFFIPSKHTRARTHTGTVCTQAHAHSHISLNTLHHTLHLSSQYVRDFLHFFLELRSQPRRNRYSTFVQYELCFSRSSVVACMYVFKSKL